MADHKTEYRSAFSGRDIDAAVGLVLEKGAEWDGKQDKLTGAAGQVVGFDENGNPAPQSTSSLVGPQGPPGEKGDKGDPGDAGSGGGLPAGCIVVWSGAEDAVPDGWALCDGANGTPDLRDRFVLGAGASYAVGATGGEATHTLTEAEMPKHYHSLVVRTTGTGITTTSALSRYTITTNTTQYAQLSQVTSSKGAGAAHNNMPPYYALCYIMKL